MVLKNLLKYQIGGLTPDKIQNIINKYGKGKSPFTAKDYIEVSKNTGVPVDLLLAQGIQESNLGTQGRAVRTRNVGNVGNTDNGAENNQKSWLEGLYGQANLLKKEYKVSSASDVQRLISNDFVRPVKGGKYATDSNYGAKVGNLINSLYGKNIYATNKKTPQKQTESNYSDYSYTPIPYVQNTLPGQVQTSQIDFWSLPSDTQNTIMENQLLQQEYITQQIEADKLEKENLIIEQNLKRKQLERQQLLSSIPQAQYVGNSSNLQPNPFTTLLQEDNQYMQQGGQIKKLDVYGSLPWYEDIAAYFVVGNDNINKIENFYNKMTGYYNNRKNGQMSNEERIFRTNMMNAQQYGYPNSVDDVMAFIDRANSGKKQGFPKEMDSNFIRTRNALNSKYYGLNYDSNIIQDSRYRPGMAKNKNAKYYDFNPDLIKRDIDLIKQNFGSFDNFYSTVQKNKLTEGLPRNPNKNYTIEDRNRNNNSTLNQLGNFTITVGSDKNGRYISYYDKWDLSPPKMKEKFGIDVNKVNNPYEIYGRIYEKDFK